jgi:SulP family sulfate permease
MNAWARWLPILDWLPNWRRPGVVRADLLAAITNAVVVLPQGLAFATLAGLPAQYGLYAAMVPTLVAALFGSSRLMVSGPANAISLTTLSLLSPLAVPGSDQYVSLAITLAMMIGVLKIGLGMVRAGRFIDLMPHSVIIGFTTGAAVLIASSQLGAFIGIEIERGLSVVKVLEAVWSRRTEINWLAITSGVATLLAISLWRRINRTVPSILVGVIAGSLVASGLQALFPGVVALKVLPALEGALPPLSTPDLRPSTMQSLLLPTLVMTLLGLAEAVAIARKMAAVYGDKLNGNREFIGQGLANLVGSFFSSFPTSGSFNRSGVNLAAGARTPLAAAFASVFLLLLVWLVGPLAKHLPYAVVAGLLFVVAWGLVDRAEIARIWHEAPRERLDLVVTFLATVTLSLQWAILLGLLTAWVSKRLAKA